MSKNPTIKKKIGFLSAIILVISSCIGAGIFFKSGTILNNVHQNIGLAISAWVIAAIGIIAMALALADLCNSCSTNSDKGFMEWNKIYNSRWIYYGCKNFMTFLYMPITYFFMPVYAMQSILDALSSFGVDVSWVPWWLILICSFFINTWFIFVSGYSSRAANVQNWIITLVKFIPLIIAMIIGFVIFGLTNNHLPENINSNITSHPSWSLFGISPAFGLFTSLSAVFFAYDGFYVACGINTQMKNPKQIPLVLIIGLSLVTVIYLLIAISCMVGSNTGDWFGFQHFFEQKGLGILYAIVSLLISFGVFGIINSYAIWTPRFIESLIHDDELFLWSQKYKNKLNPDRPKVGIVISFITFLPVLLVFSIIGALAYIPSGSYNNVNIAVQKLYNFADLSSSWTAIIVFSFICLAIYGGLKNKFNKKSKNNSKSRVFIPSAIISLIVICLALITEFIAPFFNLFSMINQLLKGNHIENDYIISTSMIIVVLFIYIFITFIPVHWDYKVVKNKLSSKWSNFKV